MNASAQHRPLTMDRLKEIYGDYASKMKDGEKYRDDMRDRTAYVYITGQFPSHLRKTYTGVLRALTSYFKKPISMDGRSGHLKLAQDVIDDLELDNHPMVLEVRRKIQEGYMIQPSLGMGTRRNFWKIFMFKLNEDGVPYGRITVQGDGSIKQGWG